MPPFSLPFTVAINEVVGPASGEQSEFVEFLHHIDEPLVIRRRQHPALIVELIERLGYRRLVGDGQHPHPSPQHAKLVHGVE